MKCILQQAESIPIDAMTINYECHHHIALNSLPSSTNEDHKHTCRANMLTTTGEGIVLNYCGGSVFHMTLVHSQLYLTN